MRIGLNLLFLIPSEVGGTETYSTSLIWAIHKLDQVNEYFLFINRETIDLDLPKGCNFHRIICPFHGKNRVMRFLWEQMVLPWQTAALNLDVLHSLGYISPLALPCKSVVTIHDLNFLSIPESFTPFTRIIQKYFVTWSAMRADRIIVVSEFVRNQLEAYLENIHRRVSVIHEAPKEEIQMKENLPKWTDLQAKYSLIKPYIFAFSSLTLHKNIARLIEAYAKLRQEGVNCQLLIVGHQPIRGTPLPKLAESLSLKRNEVIFTGYLQDYDVSLLLSHATVFAFPSLYEGFGLPALEAMATGTVVACSSNGSLPEIVGEAAVIFDPTQVDQIAQALSSLLKDETLRQVLKERGRLNLQRFSWDRAAHTTLEVYYS